jgi:hypothetical protein
MQAEEEILQRQLRNGEIIQDDYDERWSSLVLTTPPAVLKAAMTRQETVKAAPGDDHCPADAEPALPASALRPPLPGGLPPRWQRPKTKGGVA